METAKVEINLTINNIPRKLLVGVEDSLLTVLRHYSYFSVKSGCDDGTCGVCTVLQDGKPILSCKTKAVDANGTEITTLEGLKQNAEIHPIQQAFIDSSAIQCGYCTPAQILSAKALLDEHPNPSDDDIRKALNHVLCRCTGYVRVVDAVHRSAAVLRGEKVESFVPIELRLPNNSEPIEIPENFYRRDGGRNPLPPIVLHQTRWKKPELLENRNKSGCQKISPGTAGFH